MDHSFIFVRYPVVTMDSIIGHVVAPIDRLEESAKELGLDSSNFRSVVTNEAGTITLVTVIEEEFS